MVTFDLSPKGVEGVSPVVIGGNGALGSPLHTPWALLGKALRLKQAWE